MLLVAVYTLYGLAGGTLPPRPGVGLGGLVPRAATAVLGGLVPRAASAVLGGLVPHTESAVFGGLPFTSADSVSYTHLTLPTNREV